MGEARTKDGLAEFLGWFSLGLGVAQVTMPGRVNRLIGVEDDARSRFWQVVVGVREHAHAAAILTSERPVGGVWSRVAGDAMDLALIATAWRSKRAQPVRLALATASVIGIGVTDVVEALRLSRAGAPEEQRARDIRQAVTIRRPREDVERFWNDPSTRERIGGRVLPTGGDGGVSVRFVPAPGDRGTEVHVQMRYEPAAGTLGVTVAKLVGEEPEQQVRDDLRRFKQVLETGVLVRSEGSPEGPLTRRLLRQRPAQPPPQPVGAGAGNGGRTS